MFARSAPTAPAQFAVFQIAESRITLWIVEGHH